MEMPKFYTPNHKNLLNSDRPKFRRMAETPGYESAHSHEQMPQYPVFMSHLENAEFPYRATQVWRLATTAKLGEDPKKEQEETQQVFFWQRSLLACLSGHQERRVLELHYSNCTGDAKNQLQVSLIGHVHGETEQRTWSAGCEFWNDLASLLGTGGNYYQFEAVNQQAKCDAMLNGDWQYGTELQRKSDILWIDDDKSQQMGFSRQQQEQDVIQLLLPERITENCNTLYQMLQYVSQSFLPLSLRIIVTPVLVHTYTHQTVSQALHAFDRGERIRVLDKVLEPDDQERDNYRQRLSQLIESASLLVRVVCLSPAEVSRTTVNMVASALFGNLGTHVREVKLTGEEVSEISRGSYAFAAKKNQLHWLTNVEEGALLCRLPIPVIECPDIPRIKATNLFLPRDLPDRGSRLGEKQVLYRRVPIVLSDDAKAKHLYILGQTGTGKSTLMLSMLLDQINNGDGVGLIDPHGDLYEEVLTHIPKERMDDVILFDPSDVKHSVGFNPLEYDRDRPQEKSLLIDYMMEVFDKLYCLKRTGGPRFEQYMRNCMLLAMADPKNQGTILDIPKIIADSSYRSRRLLLCNNQLVKDFWKKEAERANGEAALANMCTYVTSKLSAFIYNDYIRPIVEQKHSYFNFRQVMDEGKILLVNLSKGLVGSRNSDMLGMFVIHRIFLAALSRQQIPAEQRRPFSLYIDEFQNFTTNNIAHIFAEARKFKLSLVCANQNLAQLEREICDAALGTVGNILCFRPGLKDVEIIDPWFKPEYNNRDLLDLANYSVVARLLLDDRPCKPFMFQTRPAPKSVRKEGDSVKAKFWKKLKK